jgi:hypothetical protein
MITLLAIRHLEEKKYYVESNKPNIHIGEISGLDVIF